MAKKRRSTFWVVSAHVLTTGLAIPCLVGLASTTLIRYAGIRAPLPVLAIEATSAVLGYIGGTYYSLFYLSRAAEHDHWDKCTRPSVILFTFFAFLGFAWSVVELRERTTVAITMLAVCYIAIIIGFVVITASRFARMTAAHSPALEKPANGPAEATLPRIEETDTSMARAIGKPSFMARNRSRLVGAGIGFVGGAAIGFWIMYQLGGNGGKGIEDWSQPALAALIVGGIGALLGAISGISGL